MCMESGMYSIKPLTLSSCIVHSSPWAQNSITKLHKAWSSTYLAPFAQIACWLFHLKSSGYFFVTKIFLGVSCEGSGFVKLCRTLALELVWWGMLLFLLGIPDLKVLLAMLPNCPQASWGLFMLESCNFSWICSAPKYCFRCCLAQPECCW